jgi:hypothetical protein
VSRDPSQQAPRSAEPAISAAPFSLFAAQFFAAVVDLARDAPRTAPSKASKSHRGGRPRRLSDADVAAIRESGSPTSALARRYGVSASHVYRIRTGERRMVK